MTWLNLSPTALMLLGGVILTLGDLAIKTWIIQQNRPAFWLGMAIYMAGMAVLAHTFRHRNIATASIICVVFNVITLIIATRFLYGETISRQKYLGMGVGVMAIVILEMESS
jgi:drug/metabolite transporter (DMT)-like permease